MLKFSIIAISLTPAAAKTRQSPPTALHEEGLTESRSPLDPALLSEAKPAFRRHTLLKATNPGNLRSWMRAGDAFTEKQLADMIILEQLPDGAIVMILADSGCLTACRITTDASGQNYEVLVNNRCKIDQGSTLILNRTDSMKTERTP